MTKQFVVVQEAAEEKVDWTRIDTQVKHEGKQITLPSDPVNMDYDDAINTLKTIRDQENQEFDVHEVVPGAPWDAIVALYRAMQEIYGVVMSQSIQTFFGEIKPDFITVHTGHRDTDRIQVPAGRMKLPGVSEPVHVGISPGGAYIQGTVRRRDRARLVEIAAKAREFIRTASVYKGKSIRLNVDEEGSLELNRQPEFLDLTMVKEEDIIHTRETEALIRTNVFAPLKHTDACRANKIPLKRGILLEGKYGTGKSLTARVTAKVANDNGWTFIMLNRSQGLKAAIEFAMCYQPCVIFAEDIDRAADRSDEDVNDLVNLLDGMISKTMEMMVVLTTNFIENIDRSLLRPGRFDAVISIDVPDGETAQRIIRSYCRNLIADDMDLSTVGDATAGMIPASIREVVERAKLAMLTEGRNGLTVDDLMTSAIGMRRHMALLNKEEAVKTPEQALGEAFRAILMAPNDDTVEALEEIKQSGQVTRVALAKVGEVQRRSLEMAKAAAGSASEAAKVAKEGLTVTAKVAKVQSDQGDTLDQIKDSVC